MSSLVQFAIERGELPSISTACKNFMAYRVAKIQTDGVTKRADVDRAARLEMLCARRAMQAVNGAAPEGDGPGARALRDLKGDDAAARPTASFGRSYLADEAVAAACRAHAPDPGLDGRDVEFLDAFLASAADETDDLTWAQDVKQALKARHDERKARAAVRIATREPVALDPELQAEADRVHAAVVAAGSDGGGADPGARGLPTLPTLDRRLDEV